MGGYLFLCGPLAMVFTFLKGCNNEKDKKERRKKRVNEKGKYVTETDDLQSM